MGHALLSTRTLQDAGGAVTSPQHSDVSVGEGRHRSEVHARMSTNSHFTKVVTIISIGVQ